MLLTTNNKYTIYKSLEDDNLELLGKMRDILEGDK